MWKYLAIFAVIFGLAVYVACQDERAAQESAQKAARLDKSSVPAKSDEQYLQENVPNAERHTPSWFGFFRWPNGTTTWAIILTLLAIAEQTKETARSAKAAEKAAEAASLNAKAMITSERPWLVVSIERSEYEQPDVFIVRVQNRGNTPATFEEGRWGHGFYPESESFTPQDTDFSIISEPAKTLIVGNDGFVVGKETPLSAEHNVTGNYLFERIYCVFGEITYRDTFANPDITKPYITRWCFEFTLNAKNFRRSHSWHNENT
jgi:hypothetical protein